MFESCLFTCVGKPLSSLRWRLWWYAWWGSVTCILFLQWRACVRMSWLCLRRMVMIRIVCFWCLEFLSNFWGTSETLKLCERFGVDLFKVLFVVVICHIAVISLDRGNDGVLGAISQQLQVLCGCTLSITCFDWDWKLTWILLLCSAHVKASMMGSSLTIPITGGRFKLGIWQVLSSSSVFL